MKLVSRYFSTAVLTAHAFGAVAWLAMMPRGFPIFHPRFWANQVAPWAVLSFIAIVVWVRWRRGAEKVRPFLLVLPVAWVCAAISGLVIFPISGRFIVPVALLAAGAMLSALLPLCRPNVRQIIVLGVAAIVGLLFPFSQRAGDARTHPADVGIDLVPADSESRPVLLPVLPLREDLRVQSSDGTVYLRCRAVSVDIQPMLTFISCSPDRCWTVFAPRVARVPPRRSLVAMRRHDDALQLWYDECDSSALKVTLLDARTSLIDARSHLPRPTFSHLNAFSELTIMGHKRLEIAFSPCGEQRFEVTFSDYPRGKPARVGYFDGDHTFRVVEASDAEKGPFHELGSGRLSRGEPLTITLFDRGEPFARFTFEDWSSQVSDELSPTAGWRLPANSIVFSLYENRPTAPAGVWISLADTGVGRGWDSVGHAPGTYRNRVRVERLWP